MKSSFSFNLKTTNPFNQLLSFENMPVSSLEEEELMGQIAYLVQSFQQQKKKTGYGNRAQNPLGKAEQVWLEKAIIFVENHLDDSRLSLGLLADEMSISERHLNRRVKKLTGLTANHFIREIRLHTARKLLESGELATVAEVSYAVGFETSSYFSSLFKQRFGQRPSSLI